MLKKFLTLAISRGIIEIASGILLTMAAMALVRAVPLLSDTPIRRKVYKMKRKTRIDNIEEVMEGKDKEVS